MSTAEMFEQASRMKIRFETSRGLLSTEDLWDLPLVSPTGKSVNLDSIAIALHRETRDTAETISFVTPSVENGRAAELSLKFEIVKHIIAVRVAERDEAAARTERKEKKQRLLELIAKKQDMELEGKSVDELRALAESL